jgi:hypothetical protein
MSILFWIVDKLFYVLPNEEFLVFSSFDLLPIFLGRKGL